jgi:hypothetical protein
MAYRWLTTAPIRSPDTQKSTDDNKLFDLLRPLVYKGDFE